jgi:hypothetical protein
MASERQSPEQPGQPEQENLLRQRHEAWHQFLQECRDCQQEIEPHWQFCAHCGVRLATHCPGCGNPLPPLGSHACPGCGLALPRG